MDFASVDSVYENLFSAQNFFAMHEQQELDKENYIDMVDVAVSDLDMYRFEDGGGDARGSLLLNDEYCRSFERESIAAMSVAGAATADATDPRGATSPLGIGAGAEDGSTSITSAARALATAFATATATATATTTATETTAASAPSTPLTTNINTPNATITATTHASETAATASRGEAIIAARNMNSLLQAENNYAITNQSADDFELLALLGYRPPFNLVSLFRESRPAPTLQVSDEKFVLRLDTVFVLGMHLSVTKNDIVEFFSKMGRIKEDSMTMKPKIFVYKNKLTGRSKGEATITYMSPFAAQAAIHYLNGAKFLGRMLSVVPAYMSTQPRKGVRFTYAREAGNEQQRRLRQKKWKPAFDNWICQLCKNSNFVWRTNCNRCQVGRNTAFGMTNSRESSIWRPRRHDWACGHCFNVNYWYRQICNRCSAPKSELNFPETDKKRWELAFNQRYL